MDARPAPDSGPRSRLVRAVELVVGLGLAAGVVGLAVQRWQLLDAIARTSARLPLWDEAKYGWSGLRLADALRAVDLPAFVVALHDLSVWPPTFPLLEVPAFWALGPEWSSVRRLTALLFALAVVATYGAARELARPRVARPGDRIRAHSAGAIAAAWLATAPLPQAFGTLAMLEVPGLALLALAVWAHARALRRDDSTGWRLAWLATLALVFCKYNYGLMAATAFGLAALRDGVGSWRNVAAATRARLRKLLREPIPLWHAPWRRPWASTVVAVLGLGLWVHAVGGVRFDVVGHTVSASSAGNALQILALLAVVRWATVARAEWRSMVAVWRRAAPRARCAVTWCAAPLALWLLLPPHLKELVGFVDNRSSQLGFVDALAVYARALVADFVPVRDGRPLVLVALALLAGGCVALAWTASRTPLLRLLGLLVATHAAALLVHPYRLPRFAATPLWVLAVATAVAVVLGFGYLVARGSTAGRHSGTRGIARHLLCALLPLALAAGALKGAWRAADAEAVAQRHALRTGDPALGKLLGPEGLAVGRPLVLVGTANGLSPHLARWSARLDGRPVPRTVRELTGRSDAEASRLLEAAAGSWIAVVSEDLVLQDADQEGVVEDIPTPDDEWSHDGSQGAVPDDAESARLGRWVTALEASDGWHRVLDTSLGAKRPDFVGALRLRLYAPSSLRSSVPLSPSPEISPRSRSSRKAAS
ncbi:MAG: hypothetical protein AAGC60_25705 [Acidobacteriota bacterium]